MAVLEKLRADETVLNSVICQHILPSKLYCSASLCVCVCTVSVSICAEVEAVRRYDQVCVHLYTNQPQQLLNVPSLQMWE